MRRSEFFQLYTMKKVDRPRCTNGHDRLETWTDSTHSEPLASKGKRFKMQTEIKKRLGNEATP